MSGEFYPFGKLDPDDPIDQAMVKAFNKGADNLVLGCCCSGECYGRMVGVPMGPSHNGESHA